MSELASLMNIYIHSYDNPDNPMIGHMFLINCPSLFTVLWAACKPFIDPASLQKIHLFGNPNNPNNSNNPPDSPHDSPDNPCVCVYSFI